MNLENLDYVDIDFSNKETLSCLQNMERVFQVIDGIKTVVEKAGGKTDWERTPSLHFHEDHCSFSLRITLKNANPKEVVVKSSSEYVRLAAAKAALTRKAALSRAKTSSSRRRSK